LWSRLKVLEHPTKDNEPLSSLYGSITTPSAMAVMESEFPVIDQEMLQNEKILKNIQKNGITNPKEGDRRLVQTKSLRFRKMAKSGITGSCNWAQEMCARGLSPTPEAAEQMMGFPTGWTDLSL